MYFNLFRYLFAKLEEVGGTEIKWHYLDHTRLSLSMAEASA